FVVFLPSGTSINTFINELNKFASIGTQFNSLDDFYARLVASPQYKVATDMLNITTTPHTLAFIPKGLSFQNITFNSTTGISDQLFYLETSLKPFQSGSSISHSSLDLYHGTAEFLMNSSLDQGLTLKDLITL